jgi:hypothetical protein
MWWPVSIIPVTQKTEIKRIGLQSQPRPKKKVRPSPISTNELGMVVPVCHPATWEEQVRGLQSMPAQGITKTLSQK